MKNSSIQVDLRVALLYALFGGLWILLSDRLLAAIITDISLLTSLQTYKGWFFVVTSALLIYTLLQRELTLRKITEGKFEESKERYRLLFETSIDAFLLTTPDGSIHAANPAACQMFGWTEAEIKQLGRAGMVDTSDPRLSVALDERTNKGYFRGELTFLRKDGTKFPGEISTAIFTDTQGNERTSMVIRDITGRIQAEEKLRESQMRLASIIDSAMDAIITLDADQRIILFNLAAEKLFRCSADQALGLPLDKFIPERSREAHREHIRTFGETDQTKRSMGTLGPLTCLRADGEEFPAEITISQAEMSGKKVYTAILRDVTARVQTEAALRDNEQRFRSIFEQSPIGIGVIDSLKSSFIQINPKYCEIVGRTSDEMQSMNFNMVTHPDDIDKDRDELQKLINGEIRTYNFDKRYIRPDQSVVWAHLTIVAMWEGQEEPKVHLTMVEDITARKQAEDALRESEERYRLLFENMMDGFALHEIVLNDEDKPVDYIFLEANHAFEQLTGLERKNIIGKKATQVIPGIRNDPADWIGKYGEIALTGKEIRFEQSVETINKWYAVLAFRPREGQFATIFEDVTERKLAEREIANLSRFPTENPNPVLRVQLDGQVIYANKASQELIEMWGCEVGGYLPKDINDLVSEVVESGLIKSVDVPCEDKVYAISLVPVGGSNYVNLYGSDVTERKKVEDELHRRFDELSALYQTTLDIISTQDLPSLLNTIVMRAVELLNSTSGGLYLCNSEQKQVRCVVSYNTPVDYTGIILAYGEGAAGIVADTGKPLIIDDYRTWKGRAETFEEDNPFSAVISVPMHWHEKVTGVIHVLHDAQMHKFTEEDLRLLTAFANQAAVAVENARLFEETQRRLDRLAVLRRIDQVITSSLDLRVILNIMVGQILQHLEVDATAILLYQPELQSLEFVAGQGFRTRALQSTNLRLGHGFAGQAALERKLVRVSDLNQLHTGFLRSPEFHNEEFVVYFGVPLIAKGNIIGVLEIYNRQPLHPDDEWIAFLETLAGQAAIAIDNINLFNNLEMSNLELIRAYDATIEGWARALELRDMETEGHSRRVVELTLDLAIKMGVEESQLAHIRQGALLHDIGKMGVPDSILQKAGTLTEDEWELIHQHPVYANKWLEPIAYLKSARDIPYCHHEKWDGTGYPRGLKGEEIPLAARIFAVVDVWDALRSNRPYRPKWSKEKTQAYILEQAGKHFDPEVVDAFLSMVDNEEAD